MQDPSIAYNKTFVKFAYSPFKTLYCALYYKLKEWNENPEPEKSQGLLFNLIHQDLIRKKVKYIGLGTF